MKRQTEYHNICKGTELSWIMQCVRNCIAFDLL